MKRCVQSGQVFRWQILPDSRWLGVDGEVWYLVEEISPGHLAVQSNATKADLSSFFRLEKPLDRIQQEVLAIDPRLRDYFQSMSGLRLVRPGSAREALFSFLCTPNNHIARITSMVNYLGRQGEVVAEVMGREIRNFPSIEAIAGLSEADLRKNGFGYRAKTIPVCAQQIRDLGGEAWLRQQRSRAYDEVFESLMLLPGIGPKLADCIALFAFDFTEAVPVDTHIWQALTRLYHPEWHGEALTHPRYRTVAGEFRQKFGKLSAYAHQYLFYDNVEHGRERRKAQTEANSRLS